MKFFAPRYAQQGFIMQIRELAALTVTALQISNTVLGHARGQLNFLIAVIFG